MKMITAILVDDMKPALRELEFLLKKYPEISVTGMYTDPLTAIEKIGELKPEVVFLDINMPQLQGIDAASRILDLSPETDIVFVTAFDQYAVEAFELQALDYVLKPVDPERLQKTVERLRKKKPAAAAGTDRRLQIRCLGGFKITWENREPIRWRSEKTKELFAYLLQSRERDVSKGELLDSLWPEEFPDRAIRQLYNGIYYIRKALEEYGVDRNLISIGGDYSLKLGEIDLDVACFCELGKSHYENLNALEEMEILYKGDYFAGEDYPWAAFESDSLERLYRQCLINLSKKYMEGKLYDKAESKLLKLYTKNPYEETATELLLKLYAETGEKNKAAKHFKEYRELVKKELGVNPGESLLTLYHSIK